MCRAINILTGHHTIFFSLVIVYWINEGSFRVILRYIIQQLQPNLISVYDQIHHHIQVAGIKRIGSRESGISVPGLCMAVVPCSMSWTYKALSSSYQK